MTGRDVDWYKRGGIFDAPSEIDEHLSQQPICILPLNFATGTKGETRMELKEVIQEGLDAAGFDGLCGDECGCYGKDLLCCGQPGPDCYAAYAFECFRCAKAETCDLHIYDGEPMDWVCSTGKHFCSPDYQVCQKTDKTADENGAEYATESASAPAQTCPAALGA